MPLDNLRSFSQFSSVLQSYQTLCNPIDCSTPRIPVHQQLPELPKTHVHRVADGIQPSPPLSSPSPPAFKLSQHQGLFQSQFFPSGCQRVGASASGSVLRMNFQGWFPLASTGFISLLSEGLSRVFSGTTLQKHQFCAQPSLWSSSHIHIWLLEKAQLWLYGPLSAKWCLCFVLCCLGLS